MAVEILLGDAWPDAALGVLHSNQVQQTAANRAREAVLPPVRVPGGQERAERQTADAHVVNRVPVSVRALRGIGLSFPVAPLREARGLPTAMGRLVCGQPIESALHGLVGLGGGTGPERGGLRRRCGVGPRRRRLIGALELLRNKLIRRAGRAHNPNGRLTLTMSKNLTVQAVFNLLIPGQGTA